MPRVLHHNGPAAAAGAGRARSSALRPTALLSGSAGHQGWGCHGVAEMTCACSTARVPGCSVLLGGDSSAGISRV